MNEGMQNDKHLYKSIAPSIHTSQTTLQTLLKKFSQNTVGPSYTMKSHSRGEEPKLHTDTLQS